MNIAKKTPTETGVSFTFADGQVVSVQVDTLPPAMVTRLAVHGLSQKLGDSYASANDKGLTVADCADGVRDIIGNLRNSVWSAAGGSGSSINAEALSRITGKELDECVAVLAAMNKDTVKALLKRPDMKAEVLKIKAERAEQRAEVAVDADASDLADLFMK